MKIVETLKLHPYYTALIGVVILGGGYWVYHSRTAAAVPTRYSIATAQKGNLVISVSGSGQVSTLKKLDLKPQTSGTQNQNTLIQMNVVPAQKVKTGQVVAIIDDSAARVALEQAQAGLVSAQANYNKVLGGATQIDLNTAEQDVKSATAALANAKSNLDTVIAQQNTAVSNSYRTLISTGLTAVQASWPFTSTGVTNNDLPTITGSYATTATGTYHIVQQGQYFTVTGIENLAPQKIDTHIPGAIGKSGLYIQFPNDQISAQWDINIPNPQASSYVSNLTAYQSALLSQKQAVNNAQNSVTTAEANLQKAQDALTQKQQPPTDSDIASVKAQLITAQANLHNAESNYANTRITAPFDGVIASVGAQKGDQVSGSTVIATLITEQKIVVVSLNEVDAAKTKVGDPATLTFDAVPDLTITGKVTQIDIIGTVSQGVVNYNVQIAFDSQDDRVHPSMSASAAIITDSKQDVLEVPSSAVKNSNGQSYVLLVDSSNIATQTGTTVTLKASPAEQTVTTGFTNGSMTEITDGLQEGTVVVARTIAATTAASSNAGSAVRIPGLTGGGGGGGFRGGN